jgi:hypothetical protein
MPGIGQHILRKPGIASTHGWKLASDWHVHKPLGMKKPTHGSRLFQRVKRDHF